MRARRRRCSTARLPRGALIGAWSSGWSRFEMPRRTPSKLHAPAPPSAAPGSASRDSRLVQQMLDAESVSRHFARRLQGAADRKAPPSCIRRSRRRRALRARQLPLSVLSAESPSLCSESLVCSCLVPDSSAQTASHRCLATLAAPCDSPAAYTITRSVLWSAKAASLRRFLSQLLCSTRSVAPSLTLSLSRPAGAAWIRRGCSDWSVRMPTWSFKRRWEAPDTDKVVLSNHASLWTAVHRPTNAPRRESLNVYATMGVVGGGLDRDQVDLGSPEDRAGAMHGRACPRRGRVRTPRSSSS
jgi:hypothetical protein